MRISELSRTTGVPLPTVKYYLREGLLPAGRATAATQAEYDDEHVHRLRLVRALADVGGLPLAAVRAVLQAVDAGPEDRMRAVGTAHEALPPAPDRSTPPERARDVVAALGWTVDPESSALYRLQAALDATLSLGVGPSEERFATYAQAALLVARADVESVPDASPADQVTHIVVGTVLYEPVLLALRRLAQQHLYVTQRGRRPDPRALDPSEGAGRAPG